MFLDMVTLDTKLSCRNPKGKKKQRGGKKKKKKDLKRFDK